MSVIIQMHDIEPAEVVTFIDHEPPFVTLRLRDDAGCRVSLFFLGADPLDDLQTWLTKAIEAVEAAKWEIDNADVSAVKP